MKQVFRPIGAASIAFMAATQPGLADITAAEAWSQWKDYFERAGYDVQGTEDATANGLTVSDLTLTQNIDMGDDNSRTVVTLSEIVLTDVGDGTVSVDLPDTIPVVTGGSDDSDAFEVALTIAISGDQTTVSGTATEPVHEATADRISVRLDGLSENGAPVTDVVLDFVLEMGTVASRTEVTGAETLRYDQSSSAQTLILSARFEDPEENTTGGIDTRMTGLTSESVTLMPEGVSLDDMPAAVAAGVDIDGKISFATGETSIDLNEDGARNTVSTRSNGGGYDVAINGSGMQVALRQQDLAFSAQTADIPLPFEGKVAEQGMSLTVPVTASDDPQDFALRVFARDLELSEAIWSLFDPGAILPRDPATLDIDLSGLALTRESLFDPIEGDPADLPFGGPDMEMLSDLREININTLALSAVGASISGNGAFEYNDAAAPETLAGIPPFVGALNLSVSGANGLIDRLINMGMIGPEEAMAGRMMMGLFGVPGDAPDTLTSTIEINEEGHVSANGQRLR